MYFWRWERKALRKRLDADLPVIAAEDPELAYFPDSEDEGQIWEGVIMSQN